MERGYHGFHPHALLSLFTASLLGHFGTSNIILAPSRALPVYICFSYSSLIDPQFHLQFLLCTTNRYKEAGVGMSLSSRERSRPFRDGKIATTPSPALAPSISSHALRVNIRRPSLLWLTRILVISDVPLCVRQRQVPVYTPSHRHTCALP